MAMAILGTKSWCWSEGGFLQHIIKGITFLWRPKFMPRTKKRTPTVYHYEYEFSKPTSVEPHSQKWTKKNPNHRYIHPLHWRILHLMSRFHPLLRRTLLVLILFLLFHFQLLVFLLFSCRTLRFFLLFDRADYARLRLQMRCDISAIDTCFTVDFMLDAVFLLCWQWVLLEDAAVVVAGAVVRAVNSWARFLDMPGETGGDGWAAYLQGGGRGLVMVSRIYFLMENEMLACWVGCYSVIQSNNILLDLGICK